MESITLQTNDAIISSGDSIGQLQFAASNESDGSASRYVIGKIYAQGEGVFNTSSNPASLVFATSATDNLPASGKIKISHEGHILPLEDNVYDLGSSSERFRHLYVADTVYSPTGELSYLYFDTTVGDVDQVAGQLNWNSEAGTIDLGLTDDLTIHLGQSVLFRVKNSTGSTITKGEAVYASGVLGGGQVIQVAPFAADESVDEVRFIGLMTDDLANGEDGFVNHFGHIKNVDLRTSNTVLNPNGETWNIGDILFVDDTSPGGLTKVQPKDDIYVALVLADGQNGELFVRITDPGHINDLHDVDTSGIADNNFLVWNSGLDIWEPSSNLYYVNGDIGIGTASPSAKLNIYDNNSAGFNDTSFRIQNPASSSNTYFDIAIGTSTGYNDNVWFKRNGTPVAGIYNNNSWFHYQNVSIRTDRQIVAESNGNAFIELLDGSNDMKIGYLSDLRFYSSYAEKMVLDVNGNLGIGTASPSYKLDVVGTGNFTGNILVGGDANITGDVIVGGNVTVNGTTVSANVDTMEVADPILTLGLASGNIVTNTNLDRGVALALNDGIMGFMGWDTSENEFSLLSSGVASNGSGNYAPGTYGDLHAGRLILQGDSTNTTWTDLSPTLAIKNANSSPYITFHGNDGSRIGILQFDNDSPSTLGVVNSQPLRIRTNNQDRIYIEGGGNVGIATSSPSYKLDVNGTAGFSSTINAPNIGAGEDDSVVILDSDGKLRTDEIDSRVWGSSLVDGAGSSSGVVVWSDSDTLTYDSSFIWDSTNNRLGIGTSSPSKSFHIKKASNEPIESFIKLENDGRSVGIDFTASSNGQPLNTSQIVFDWYGNSYGSSHGMNYKSARPGLANHWFRDDTNAVQMSILDNGNVGIGTSSPSYKLYVNGTTGFSSTIYAPNIGAGTDNSVVVLNSAGLLKTDEIDSRVWGSTLADMDDIAYVSGLAVGASGVNGTGSSGQVAFWTDTNTISNDTDLVWDSGTNRLGVGISAPSGTLHIVGTAHVDNLKLDGNTLSSTNTNGNVIITPNGTGGIAAGAGATVTGGYAVVGGGRNNSASSYGSTISGGVYNDTSIGFLSTIGGGSANTACATYSTVSGGHCNVSSGSASTVSGGNNNTASGACSFIGGGQNNCTVSCFTAVVAGSGNIANQPFTNVGGGYNNNASLVYSNIGGGCGNSTSGYAAFVGGGKANAATDGAAVVAGGWANAATCDYASVGGGYSNNASGNSAIIGGGYDNTAAGNCSTVSGGLVNSASANYSAVGGGRYNQASAANATVGGGRNNVANNNESTVGGGYANNASASSSVVSGGKCNIASGACSTVSGGYCNKACGNCSTVGGGCCNTASNAYATIAGGRWNTSSATYSFVGAGVSNTAQGSYSVVAGGRMNNANASYVVIGGGYSHYVGGSSATVAGGYDHYITGGYAAIGGGRLNCILSCNYSTIGGGYSNCITNHCSTISGGYANIVSGANSTIAGGRNNALSGDYSFTAGYSNNDGGYANVHILGSGITATQADTTYTQNIIADGHLAATTKSFLINHPTRPGHKLQYGSLESPYHGVRLTGRDKITSGWCVVKLPEYIRELVNDNQEINIQLTNYQHSKVLYVDSIDIKNNEFTVKTKSWFSDNAMFFWSFTATRKDIDPLRVEY